MDTQAQASLLRLFNAIEVLDYNSKPFSKNGIFRMLSNGYVLDNRITIEDGLLDLVDSTVGIGGVKLNSTFHKSWNKVANADIEQLFLEQILHYFTTYGFESLGIYDDSLVYIPAEKLEIPAVTEDIPLLYIKALSPEEVYHKIVELGSSGIALHQDTLDDIMVVIKANNFESDIVGEITNRELYTLLCELYDFVPSDPTDYLRYLVAKLTGESLLIKNSKLIAMIKVADGSVLDEYLDYAPSNLAEIFLRFKPLFLAMKSISNNKTFFNRLRKQANTQHVPMQPDYLNTVTSQISQGVLSMDEFNNALDNYPIWRKIRLAYALNNRLYAGDSIVYRVRNGKAWVSDFDWSGNGGMLRHALGNTLASIAYDIRDNIETKTFYIPEGVSYSVPATQKQFVGNVPVNSYVSVPDSMLLGVHWCDVNGDRVDIDLALLDVHGKYGWDGSWRSTDRNILFSGDNTSAPLPNGASEFHYLSGEYPAKILMSNYFNYSERVPVDLQLIVASETSFVSYERNYMVDPSKVVASQHMTQKEQEVTLGMAVNVDDENRFYFSSSSFGNSRTSRVNEHTVKAINFMMDTMINSIRLEELIEMAGGTIVREMPEDIDFVNLSVEALDKNTIIDLLTVRE